MIFTLQWRTFILCKPISIKIPFATSPATCFLLLFMRFFQICPLSLCVFKLLRHNFLHAFMCSPLFVVKTLRKYGLHNVGSIKFTHFTPAEPNLPLLRPQAITILQPIYPPRLITAPLHPSLQPPIYSIN